MKKFFVFFLFLIFLIFYTKQTIADVLLKNHPATKQSFYHCNNPSDLNDNIVSDDLLISEIESTQLYNKKLVRYYSLIQTMVDFKDSNGDIKPYKNNPWYWEYKGSPILLRGASDSHNLFQWTGKQLTDHLDLLLSIGGNFVRNTMSDREPLNVYAHKPDEEGMYNLNVWNEEYWDRLEFFLEQTLQRDIIVQLTLWDWFDLFTAEFDKHPLNPASNRNWEPGLIKNSRDFYGGSLRTGNIKVLEYQQKYIDKLLSVTFKYNNILYNINNESSVGAYWENYWAQYLIEKASDSNKEIYVTSMQVVPSNSVRHVLTYRDLFSFAEISQNNQDSRGGRGKTHYDNIIYWREMIASDPSGPMPINNEKIYGGGIYPAGTVWEGEDRFWKNVFAGCAAVRFHRPATYQGGFWGIGLSDIAQANIKSLTSFLDEFDLFEAVSYKGIKMIGSSEGYAMAIMGRQYAVYFPGGRHSVEFDPWVYAKKVKVRYLDIPSSEWSEEKYIDLEWKEELSNLFGFQRGINITSQGHNPCIAIIDIME
jgi:hypothetical protein